MPLKTKYKKKTYRKSNYQKKTNYAVRRITNMIEKKRLDNTIASNFGNDVLCETISLMAQGDTSAARQGLKITAKRLNINMSIQWKATATQETSVRFLVFIDTQSAGARPLISDVLENVSVTGEWKSRNQGRRFIILLDKLINNKNATTAVSKIETHRYKLKVNKNIYYIDSTSNATALGRNQLYYALVGDVLSADADTPTASGTARLYYEDL